MTDNGFKHRGGRSRLSTEKPISSRVRDLAEAGAKGYILTPVEMREVCEAYRSQSHTVRTQFHSGT